MSRSDGYKSKVIVRIVKPEDREVLFGLEDAGDGPTCRGRIVDRRGRGAASESLQLEVTAGIENRKRICTDLEGRFGLAFSAYSRCFEWRGMHNVGMDIVREILLFPALALVSLYPSRVAAHADPPVPVAGGNCTISGRVTDDRGRPVKYAAVNAISESATTGTGIFGATANERGEYCISVFPGGSDLPPGQYRIRARGGTRPPSASPSCRSCCVAATDLGTTFYPDSVSMGAAKPLLVLPQRPLCGIDIHLRRGPVYCVRGEARDLIGALLQRATIGLKFEAGEETAGVITEGGRFLLTNLPPGVYTLTLLHEPHFGHVVAQQVFHVRDRNIDRLVITAPWVGQSPATFSRPVR